MHTKSVDEALSTLEDEGVVLFGGVVATDGLGEVENLVGVEVDGEVHVVGWVVVVVLLLDDEGCFLARARSGKRRGRRRRGVRERVRMLAWI